jgi:hypothetical protein
MFTTIRSGITMKKIKMYLLLIIGLMFNLNFVFPQAIEIIDIGGYEYGGYLYICKDKNVFVDSYNYINAKLIYKYAIVPNSAIFMDKDGYTHIQDAWIKKYYSEPPSSSSKDKIVITGVFQHYEFNEGLYRMSEWEQESLAETFDDKFYLEDIKKIESSSFLTENIGGKKIEYEPKNLFKKRLPLGPRESRRWSWLADSIPWVEGKADSGIGESITVSLENPVNVINILNGYVDIEKKHLYRQNNRVSVMKIIDLDNNKEYILNFKDKVYYNSQVLDGKTRNIKLIIEDVYKGTKFNDTCITEMKFEYVENAKTIDEERLKFLTKVIIESEEVNVK